MVRKIGAIFIALTVLCLLSGRVLKAEDVSVYYQITCREPDGENGYFKTPPEITIQSMKENQRIRYQVSCPNGKKITGSVTGKSNEAKVAPEIFSAGEYLLDVWAEERNGKILSGSETTKKVKIDRRVPEGAIRFLFNENRTVVEIRAEDDVSGVEGIYYKWGNSTWQYAKGNHIFVTVPEGFWGKLYGYVTDCAGNTGSVCAFQEAVGNGGMQNEVSPSAVKEAETVLFPKETGNVRDLEETFEKKSVPQLEIVGIRDSMIVGFDVALSCRVTAENPIETLTGRIVWEKPGGEREEEVIRNWEKEGDNYAFQTILKEEGMYQLSFEVTDAEGNHCEEKRQLIIDKTSPTIQKVNEINGTRMAAFWWNYDIEEIVCDFTTYTYEVRLDGVLCNEKKKYTKQGRHTLEVRVTDSAGNMTIVEAKFEIAREKGETS